MGSCCVKPSPDIQVDIEGNTCFDDIECSSTCCVIKKKTYSPKHSTNKYRKKVQMEERAPSPLNDISTFTPSTISITTNELVV